MEIPWHDYTDADSNALIANADLIEKASVIGRVGLIMLSCGTGAWRVRTSMNKLSKELGVTCTVDVGLMSIEFNCFDGNDCVSQSLSIANTLRLELVDFTGMPAAAAAFIGAAAAGLLASFIKNYNGYPRISLTVPSIVIMVPGLYLYRAIYNFGIPLLHLILTTHLYKEELLLCLLL